MRLHPAVAFAVLALTACGGGTEKAPENAAPAVAAMPNQLTITARDFAFDAPDTVPGGFTTITLVNHGTMIHHAQLIRLDDGKTMDDVIAALKAGGPIPAWAHLAGGPNPPNPGEQTSISETLEPGNYALICLVDVPDHIPHVMKGMYRMLVVTPSTTTAAEPVADDTIQLVNYMFNDSPPLSAGKHTIRIENVADQPHELFLVKLDSAKTVDGLMQWAQTYKGPPPFSAMGGVAAISPGMHAFMDVDLTPGTYVMLCFVPDAKDGKPHVQHGMMKAFTIS
jgi:hypothetical protein